jgi:hypothetical protein
VGVELARRGLGQCLRAAEILLGGIEYLVDVAASFSCVKGCVDLRPLAVLVTGAAVRRAETMSVEEALTRRARARLQALDKREAVVRRPTEDTR